MPPLFLAVHTAGSTFGYLTIGSSTDTTVTFFGTLATDLVCVALLWLYSLLVCRPASTPAASAPTEPALAEVSSA